LSIFEDVGSVVSTPFFQGAVVVSWGGKKLPFFWKNNAQHLLEATKQTQEDMEKLQMEQKLLDAELEVKVMGF